MADLSNPHTVAYYAAQYEAEQAERDYSEAYAYMQTRPHHNYTAEYATWSSGGYADTAHHLVRDMPVWEK